MSRQEQTLGHTGDVVGSENVSLSQNRAGAESEILSITAPTKFEGVEISRNHDLRFTPRSKETFSGDGAKTSFDLATNLSPIAGEKNVEDQDYPVVEAVDTTDMSKLDVVDVDYTSDSIEVAEAPASGADNVAVFPVVSTGELKAQGQNALGQSAGPIAPFGIPIYRFSDVPQLSEQSSPGLDGSVSFDSPESVVYLLESPQEIVWEDEDHPDAYVSSLSVGATVEV